jgi:acetone carboxylase gamma subunit
MHRHVFVGKDREDRIYRCQCGHRKVEIYSQRVDRIGWKKNPAADGGKQACRLGGG